jgi:pentatricopeptide repeat protein
MSYLGAAYWLAGSPERGLRELERAAADAIAHGDPYTLGLTAINLARFRLLCNDAPSEIRAIAEGVLANDAALVWHVQASMIVDWARSREAPLSHDDVDRMFRSFRERVDAFPMGTTYLAIAMIDALGRSGRPGEASALIEEMVVFARDTGELLFEPELIRMRGERIEVADPVAAAAAYREAITLARASGAWSLELRAAVQLAGLPMASGERGSALADVAAALAHITDGFTTPDVVAANQLLAARPS